MNNKPFALKALMKIYLHQIFKKNFVKLSINPGTYKSLFFMIRQIKTVKIVQVNILLIFSFAQKILLFLCHLSP